MDEIDFYLVDLKSRFDKIKPNTYYLSYSGGKDSHFLYWFIKEYLKRDDIKIVGINTYMEHHEIRDRILKNSDIVLKPKLKPFEIKAKYGSPCFSKIQDDFIDRYQRGSRSKSLMERIQARQFVGKDEYKTCFTKDKKFTPLHDLSDELLDKIYQKYNIEIPQVYNHICRTGCMGCPYGSYKHDTEKELALLNDNQLKFVSEYFKESYEVLGIKPQRQMTIEDLKKGDE